MASIAPLSYSVPQRALHWVTVFLIGFNLIVESSAEKVVDLARDGKIPTPDELSSANLHAYVGIAVIALTVLRLILRLVQGAPEAPVGEPPLFQRLAMLAHLAFYGLLFIMPLAGIGAYYFGNGTAGFLHGGPMKLLLWLLIVGHVGAVLMHKFIWKTNVLDRMTKGVKA